MLSRNKIRVTYFCPNCVNILPENAFFLGWVGGILHFVPPDTHIVWVSGGKKCKFFDNFCVRTKWVITYLTNLKFASNSVQLLTFMCYVSGTHTQIEISEF